MSAFVWTEKGTRIHISDDGTRTRCGWPVQRTPTSTIVQHPPLYVQPDDVLWFGVCARCRRDNPALR